jgi:formylglycine-generating enzyme required for sulfatase activity
VFVCHASDDKAQVRELCRRLREDGFEPWLDEERLLPGQDWEIEISAAVRSCDAVIVCLSIASVGKVGYLQKELRLVLDVAEYQPEGRIFVVPVRLEECTLPVRLRRWQYADLFTEDGYRRLKRALTAPTERRDEASPPPVSAGLKTSFNAPRPRRWFTLVAGVLIVIASGATLYRILSPTSPKLPSDPPPADIHSAKTAPEGMIFIPGGRFLMGRNDHSDKEASPAHEVAVTGFYLDRTPVTNIVFTDFLRSTNKISPADRIVPGGDQTPVTQVTWDDAAAYCLAGGKRLPSEAEWEFAARGADGRLYPWGEAFDADAVNSRESGIGHPEPVAVRPRNLSVYGVADMSGNVWQWCADDYRQYAKGSLAFAIPDGAKVIRGGSYQSDRLHVTAVTRNLELPSTRSAAIGFRCAK